MKLISWNVNGFRAVLKKGFEGFFHSESADIFCLQETKMQEGQADFMPEGYRVYFHSAARKGYSGTAVFSKAEPLDIAYGIHGGHTDEGRVMTLDYPGFALVNCYVPNAQPELARLPYRMAFEDDIRAYLAGLAARKPVIYCGDLNVAHNEIDLRHPRENIGHAGFSYEERGKMTDLLASGFTDTFRYLYPDRRDAYTWWSYIMNARASNAGWRIDYFLVSDALRPKVRDALIYSEVMGSDHCPVGLLADL